MTLAGHAGEPDVEPLTSAVAGRLQGRSLAALSAALPPALRAAIDTGVLARLRNADRRTVERLAAATGAHVVAYDRRAAETRRALCATVRAARLDRHQIAALRAAERELGASIALVAYARPVERAGRD